MLTLYHAPRSRSLRVVWLCEELGIPYAPKRVTFVTPGRAFSAQDTPLGKLPVIEDGEVTICESGAIIEYVVERHGGGRLAPPIGSPLRAEFLQWMHFCEGTAAVPMSTLIWHMRYKGDAERVPEIIDDARVRAQSGLAFVERGLAGKTHLLGAEFSAADVMMGFTLLAARVLGVLDEQFPLTTAYLARLEARPAFQRAVAA